jgi:hypothetical protein
MGGEENLSVDVGAQLESHPAHDFDQGGQNLFISGIVGGTNRSGEFLAVLPSHLLGDSGDPLRLDSIKHPDQKFDQKVITPTGVE